MELEQSDKWSMGRNCEDGGKEVGGCAGRAAKTGGGAIGGIQWAAFGVPMRIIMPQGCYCISNQVLILFRGACRAPLLFSGFSFDDLIDGAD